jgi:hypothetical protein
MNQGADASSIVGRLLSDTRMVAAMEWGASVGMSTSQKDAGALMAAFHKLPYEERRKWYVRPSAFAARLARASLDGDTSENSREAEALAAYRKSGDASHAMRVVGVEFDTGWVEQKRNSQGLVEILACDLGHDPDSDLNQMELAEMRGREDGLYEGLSAQVPESQDDEGIVQPEQANALLAIARETLPQEWLAVFLLAEVDGMSRREIARQMGMSQREVRRVVDATRHKLRSIAEEAKMK